MDHLKILKRALNITWKYRALWLVGLLLVLAGGGVASGFRGSPGSPGSGGDGGRGRTWQWEGLPPHVAPSEVWEKVAPIAVAIGVVLLLLLLLAIAFGIVAVVVRYVTRVSLIQMVQSYEETGEEIGFGSGLRLGWSRSAFRLFLINLMLKLPLALIILLLIAGLAVPAGFIFSSGPSGTGTALGVVLALLIIPVILVGIVVGVALGPIIQVAQRICVLEDLGAWEAIVEAFGLARRNLGPTALQWLLLVGLGIAWGIAMIPVNLLLVVLAVVIGGLPALLVGGLAALIADSPFGFLFGLLVLVPAFILIISLPNIALSTLATVFYSTTWTLTYRELCVIDAGKGEDEEAELERAGLESEVEEMGPKKDAPTAAEEAESGEG